MYKFLETPFLDNVSGEPDPFGKAKMEIAKWTGRQLEKHFSGYPWMVKVEMNPTGGLISISMPALMGDKTYYNLQLNDVLVNANGSNLVVKAAGELLERYGLPRRAAKETNWRDAMSVTGGVNLGPLK